MVLYWKKIGLGRCRRSHICDDGNDADDADESSVMMMVIMIMVCGGNTYGGFTYR